MKSEHLLFITAPHLKAIFSPSVMTEHTLTLFQWHRPVIFSSFYCSVLVGMYTQNEASYIDVTKLNHIGC